MPQPNREILPNGRETKFYAVGLQILASHPDAKLVVERAPEDASNPGTPLTSSAQVIDEQPAPGPWTLKDNTFKAKLDDRSVNTKPWFYRFRQVSTSFADSDWWPSNSTWLKVTPARKEKDYTVPSPPPYPLAIIKQNDIPGKPDSVRITIQPFPEHDDIVMKYQVVDASTGQPARGDGSWTTYSGAFDQARDDVDRDKIFAFADLNDIAKGPVSGELIETDRRPLVVNISLALDDAGNVDATVTADADTGSVRVAADTSSFPTKGTTQGASATNLSAGVADVQDIIQLQPGETAFVSVLPYTRTGGGGAEGEMAQAKITMSVGFFDNAIERVLIFQRGDHLYASVRAGSAVESIKFNTSTSSFPAAGSGTCQDLDADASVSVDLGAFLYADEVYITITPYDAVSCGGNQGREHQMRHQLETDDKLLNEATGDINPRRIDSDQLTLGSWQTQAVPNLGSYAIGPTTDTAFFQIRWDDSNSRLYLKLAGDSLVSDASVKWKLVLKGNGSFDTVTDVSLEAGEGINLASSTEAESDNGAGTAAPWSVSGTEEDEAYITMSGVDDSTRILLKIIGTNDDAHGVLDQLTYGGAILETNVDVDESVGGKPFEHEFLLKAEITATKINVTKLSAISADVGLLTAGKIESSATSNTFMDLDASGSDVFLQVYDTSSASVRLSVTADGVLKVKGTVISSTLKIAAFDEDGAAIVGGQGQFWGPTLVRQFQSHSGTSINEKADVIRIKKGEFELEGDTSVYEAPVAQDSDLIEPTFDGDEYVFMGSYVFDSTALTDQSDDTWTDPDLSDNGINVLSSNNNTFNATVSAGSRLFNDMGTGSLPSYNNRYSVKVRIRHDGTNYSAGAPQPDGDAWTTTVSVEYSTDNGSTFQDSGESMVFGLVPDSEILSSVEEVTFETDASEPGTGFHVRLKMSTTWDLDGTVSGSLSSEVEIFSTTYNVDNFPIEWATTTGNPIDRRGVIFFGAGSTSATAKPHYNMQGGTVLPDDGKSMEGDVIYIAGTDHKMYVFDGTSWVSLVAGGVGGSGSVNQIPRFSASQTLTDSSISDDGTDVISSANINIERSGGYFRMEDTSGSPVFFRIVQVSGDNFIQTGQAESSGSMADLKITSWLGADTWVHINTSGDVIVGDSSAGGDLLINNQITFNQTPSSQAELIRFLDVDGHAHVIEAGATDGGEGIALRALTSPPSGDAIWEVRSSGNAQRWRVEHNGAVGTVNNKLRLGSASADNSAIVLNKIGNNLAIIPTGGGTGKYIIPHGAIHCDSDADGRLVLPVGADQWAT